MCQQASYREILAYIYHFTDYEMRGLAAYSPEFYNLDRMRRLLSMLGDPHRSFRSVHIAGTKGKGSTSAMIEAALRVAGYDTALYTSPHLHTFRERIQTGGELIPEVDVLRLALKMLPLLDHLPNINTFEVMTGLAFSWFAEQGVEIAVLEVGLGGRLDATNVVTPDVSVITSISRDHTAILGETRAEIAVEKAGIIKPGVPLVTSPQRVEAMDVIEATCQERGSPLIKVGRDWTWQVRDVDLNGQSFAVWRGSEEVGIFGVPLLGEYQVENAVTAVAALSLLERAGFCLPVAAVAEGLGSVRWPGRLEVLARAPFVVVDSAHNGSSARKLVTALWELIECENLIMILGASADHVTKGLLEALCANAARIIVTQTHHPKAASPVWIQEQVAELGFDADMSHSVPQALELALASAQTRDLICFAGSVFIAAEARVAWFRHQGMDLPPSDPS